MSVRAAVLAVFLPVVSPAWAQDPRQASADFSRLQGQLKVGDEVVVSIRDGTTIKGRFADTSDTQIAVLANDVRREVPADQVTRVQRRRNGILFGALIGTGVGIYSGMAFRSWAHNERGDETRAFLFPLAAGMGTGVAIDALLVRTRTVFERTPLTRARLSVNVWPGRMAAQMTVGF